MPRGYAMNVYLKRLRLPSEPKTRCQRHLSDRIAERRKANRWQLSDSPGWTPHAQRVAPGVHLAARFKLNSEAVDVTDEERRARDPWLRDEAFSQMASRKQASRS